MGYLDAMDEAIKANGGAAAVAMRAVEAEPSLVRKLTYISAHELDEGDADFDDELIEGVIGRNAMVVLYGDSNSGKTFLAIDIGASVCRVEKWMGRPTAGGLVVYLATEAAASVKMRARAYQRRHKVRLNGFVIVQSPINLFDGQADTTAVIALITALESEYGEKVALIIGDTLARISAGANENNGQDMGVVLKNASSVTNATGATFLWIHHTGKDQAKGMRGWSGMRAAIDTEIEISADDMSGVRTAEITKQRDLPSKGDRFGFTLEMVPLGVNRWGTSRGSCVVIPTGAPEKQVRGKRPSEIAGAITEFLTERGSGCLKGAMVKHFEGRYPRQSVYRELNKMVDGGMLIEAAGIVAMPGKAA